MRDPLFVVVAAALAAFGVFCSSSSAASLAELCGAGAEPCVVSQPVEVAGDFDLGLRALRVEGAGRIDVAAGGAAIACGRLELRTSGVAVRVRDGATLSASVRRGCSLAPHGACLTDADCADLAAGDCSGGDGAASIDGAISADGETAGTVVLRAAGDALVRSAVTARGTRAEADGGTVEIESTTGAVAIEAAIDVSGGGAAAGGDVDVLAAADLVVRAPIRATGGEYDGGQVWLTAGRDVVVQDDVAAAAAAGAGFGGAVVVEAARDAVLDGGTATNGVVIDVDGHQSVENYGGDGGTIDVEAGRDVVATRYVRFEASGAAPDGFADTLSFTAEGLLLFDATIVAKGRGVQGGGAIVDLVSGADLDVSPTASFDLTGAAVGGDLTLESGGALAFAGAADASSSSSGVAGRILAISDGDAAVSGRWTTSGGASSFSVGDLFVEACRASVTGTLANAAGAGRTTIVARESAHVGAGGSIVTTGTGGTNTLRHRVADAPPVVDGSVRPDATVVVDETLEPCTGCSSQPETCRDAELCTGLCVDAACSVGELLAPSLVLRAGRSGTSGIWKGEVATPAHPLDAADVRIVAAAATSGPLLDETLAAGSLRAAGAGWRLQPGDAAGPVRKAAFRPGSSDGLLRVRIKLGLGADAFAGGDAVSLALLVAEPADGGETGASATVPCADSGLLACERTRRRTLCTSP